MKYDDLQIGLRVKVTKAAPYYEEQYGIKWRNTWAFDMSGAIGKIFTIESFSFNGVRFVERERCCANYAFPWSVLELENENEKELSS